MKLLHAFHNIIEIIDYVSLEPYGIDVKLYLVDDYIFEYFADIKERLAKQRQQLNARLGLDVASKLGMDLTSMYTNDDLCPVKVQIKIEAPRVSYCFCC